ncbi:MAG: class I tRNA ligase family protein, partial [Patescibacteria group bacterium]
EKYEHSYPHCWRCETPLINYATSSWFVNITKIKGRALKLAKDINWSPSHIKEGRFGKWLEGARDWSISRQRYWASAIPIWKCEKCKEVKVVGSVDEIRNNIETPKNTYFVMRHGWAESNGENWVSARLETSHKYPLTKKGKEEVLLSAEKLKDKKIDLIFYSEFERTKETAFLVAEKIGLSADKIIPDRRIIEMNVGDFEGGPVDDYHKYFNSLEEKFYKNPPNGDNLNELKKRVGDFIYEIDAKYKNKKILIISHEYPIWMIFAVADGLNEKQAVEIKKGNNDFIKTSEIKEINFIPLPHNQNYELDLHRPYIDEVEFDCECGGKMRRIQDVLDTWFDSGSMPYAQVHYPFENKEKFEENFPAEFIAEGVDQTRAWFYYLHCIATAINDSRAFNNVIVNGIVLAEDGKKMAKRLQNYPDPINVMEKYGADALRFYLLSSPVVKAENLSFSEKGVDEAHKKVIMRLKNVLAFYKMYVLNSNLKNKISNLHNENILDKWILTRLNQLTGEITKAMDKYELSEAVRPIGDFVEDLSNWYVRRSRERFKNEDNDKNNATATLHHVLIELSKLIAPFMPFV